MALRSRHPQLSFAFRRRFGWRTKIGYNAQFGKWVLGAEADVNFGDLSKNIRGAERLSLAGALAQPIFNLNPGDVISSDTNSVFTARHSLGAFGTIRARAGFAFDRYLVFVTGGLVVADLKTTGSYLGTGIVFPNLAPAFGSTNVVFSGTGSLSKVAFGSAVGGGVEAFVMINWSIKAEYLYIRLPSQTINVSDGVVGQRSHTFDSNFHIGRVGIKYHF